MKSLFCCERVRLACRWRPTVPAQRGPNWGSTAPAEGTWKSGGGTCNRPNSSTEGTVRGHTSVLLAQRSSMRGSRRLSLQKTLLRVSRALGNGVSFSQIRGPQLPESCCCHIAPPSLLQFPQNEENIESETTQFSGTTQKIQAIKEFFFPFGFLLDLEGYIQHLLWAQGLSGSP